MEWTVRNDAADQGAPEIDSSDHARSDLHASVLQHRVHAQDHDCLVGGALFSGGRDLVSVRSRLQHERRRVGGTDCPARN